MLDARFDCTQQDGDVLKSLPYTSLGSVFAGDIVQSWENLESLPSTLVAGRKFQSIPAYTKAGSLPIKVGQGSCQVINNPGSAMLPQAKQDGTKTCIAVGPDALLFDASSEMRQQLIDIAQEELTQAQAKKHKKLIPVGEKETGLKYDPLHHPEDDSVKTWKSRIAALKPVWCSSQEASSPEAERVIKGAKLRLGSNTKANTEAVQRLFAKGGVQDAKLCQTPLSVDSDWVTGFGQAVKRSYLVASKSFGAPIDGIGLCVDAAASIEMVAERHGKQVPCHADCTGNAGQCSTAGRCLPVVDANNPEWNFVTPLMTSAYATASICPDKGEVKLWKHDGDRELCYRKLWRSIALDAGPPGLDLLGSARTKPARAKAGGID
jgi:hypothetical protein